MAQPAKTDAPQDASWGSIILIIVLMGVLVFLIGSLKGKGTHGAPVGWEDAGPDVRSDGTPLASQEQRQLEAATKPYEKYPPLAVAGTDMTPAGPRLEVLVPVGYQPDHQPPLSMEDIVTAVALFEDLAQREPTHYLEVYYGPSKLDHTARLFRVQTNRAPTHRLLLLGVHTENLLYASMEGIRYRPYELYIPSEHEYQSAYGVSRAKFTTPLGFEPEHERIFLDDRQPLRNWRNVLQESLQFGSMGHAVGSNEEVYAALCEMTLEYAPIYQPGDSARMRKLLRQVANGPFGASDICTPQATALTVARGQQPTSYTQYLQLMEEERESFPTTEYGPDPDLEPVSRQTYEHYSE